MTFSLIYFAYSIVFRGVCRCCCSCNQLDKLDRQKEQEKLKLQVDFFECIKYRTLLSLIDENRKAIKAAERMKSTGGNNQTYLPAESLQAYL